LFLGALAEANFLSVDYLVQQLQIASFLGVIATGVMLVILLGHIDLSIPWTIAIGGMMATAATGFFGPTLGVIVAVPFGILCGVGVGLVNGLGVAYLRAPSMIFTLGMNAVAQGLAVVHTGGFAPQDRATETMHGLATGNVLGIPNVLLLWIAVAVAMIFMLNRTTFGRKIYAVDNRERAAYLSGVNTRLVILACFTIAGACSALGGVLLAGYATKAYQAMGELYLLPAIAAVVLGGTRILGGKGSYVGTMVGVILITLLQSILSVMQMPEMGRQIIYGVAIITMLLIYGRGAKTEG
jgi:ribose transport system permease protein